MMLRRLCKLASMHRFALSISALSGLQACGNGRDGEQAYRLNAEVMSGNQSYFGTGVRSLRAERRAQISAETPPVVWYETGQATVVELDAGHALYILLDGRELPTATASKLADVQLGGDILPALRGAAENGKARALREFGHVERHDRYRYPYPRMVYFLDEEDPATLRFVEPGGHFSIDGTSFVVKALWVEPSETGVQPEPIARLPWLASRDAALTDPTFVANPKMSAPVAFASNFSTWYLNHD